MGREDFSTSDLYSNTRILYIRSNGHVLTYLMLRGVARDDHGHYIQTLGAEAQAVNVGDVRAFVVHRLHQLNESNEQWQGEEVQLHKTTVSVLSVAGHTIGRLT